MDKARSQLSILPDKIWTISAKLRGLSDLFNLAQGDSALSNAGLKGLSYLLSDLAVETDEMIEKHFSNESKELTARIEAINLKKEEE